MTRRSFLRSGSMAVATAGVGTRCLRAKENDKETLGRFHLKPLGKIEPVSPLAIEASPFSVGFETLDRQHFDPEKTYPHLARLGAKWARCQTGWCRCEKAKGQYTFEWLDRVVDTLLKIGVQPWFSISYGNQLYTPEAGNPTAVGWAPIFDEEARRGWVNYTRAIARHFRDRVRHWEIWNEPNISGFWKPRKPSPCHYADMVALTAPEIRKAIPKAVIIGGALAGMSLRFLEGSLEAGMGQHADKVSYHPYRAVPEAGYASEIQKARDILAKYNKKIKLWQGENGCPSKGGKGSAGALSKLDWNETRQAKWVLRRMLTDLKNDIELSSYFHLVDLVGYRNITNYKGLLRGADYSPKPSFFAYQRLCALFDAKTERDAQVDVELVDQTKVNMQDASFVRNGRAVHAYWYPANLQEGWNPRPVTLRLPLSASATISEPVLVDLLSGAVYALEPAKLDDKSLTLENLPLLDYPVLVTDRSVVL